MNACNIFVLRKLVYFFTVRPLDVKMVNKKLALSAEKEYTLECQSSGARPPAVMTWMRGSSKIKHHRESVSSV